jgi:uncharacterized membrane protein (UPF0127 family)
MFRTAVFLLVAGLSASVAAQGYPVLELAAGIHRIEAEVVNTMDSRMLGLMGRREMPVQHGMLFVFDADARHCMWMKNTLLPLAVAFIDNQGRIVNVEEMQPGTETNHCASKPVHFALEMNAGWFRSRHLGPGAQISGIDRAPPAR